jgi:hypothetical protein
MNQQKQYNRSSIYKGVSWHGIRNKWSVYIKINKTKIYMGLCTDEIIAALRYDAAACYYFGEFARLNFPL